MRKLMVALAGVVALGSAGQAMAGPVTFDLGSANVSLTSFNGIGGTPVLTPYDFSGLGSRQLSLGDTWEFSLFSIKLPALGAGVGTVSASLFFDLPTDAVATGSANGAYASFILGSFGSLEWTSQPTILSLQGGGSYSVAFQNLTGLTLGRTTDVHAILTLLAEPGELGTPEPGTLALLGLGMLGVALASRRRGVAARAT
jgi:hypothetical protein